MSIATEITRLQDAKAAIKTAIEGKGQTVADTARLSDFAALIEAISTGHEFPTVMKNVKVTAVTATENSYCTIPWDSDTLPVSILVFDTASPSSGNLVFHLQKHSTTTVTTSRVRMFAGGLKYGTSVNSGIGYLQNVTQSSFAVIENSTLTIRFNYYNSGNMVSGSFTSGHTLVVITYGT